MEVIQKLGVALGFATLAGVNLYLTVFVTSLALYNHWIELGPQYADLQILGHPAIVITAGVLYFLEFLADKVPWVDSIWDAVHTVIRPLGVAFLALKTLGTPDPTFDIVVALLAGGVALTTHGAKAGTRLLVNGSPEPFSNIAVSVAEDVGVLAGLGLMTYSYKHNPYLSLIVFGSIICTLLYLTPKLFRFARIKIWLLWKKISSPAADPRASELKRHLPADYDILLARTDLSDDAIAWAVPCLTGSSKGGLPANFSGYLVALSAQSRKLHFVGKRGWRSLRKELDLAGYKATHESRFLSEDLVLYHMETAKKYVFIFDRSKAGLVHAAADSVRARLTGGLLAGEVAPVQSSSEPESSELVSA
jgi:hypothetical protein